MLWHLFHILFSWAPANGFSTGFSIVLVGYIWPVTIFRIKTL